MTAVFSRKPQGKDTTAHSKAKNMNLYNAMYKWICSYREQNEEENASS